MNVTVLEPWMTKSELATFFGCSVRWIEDRVAEKMPSAMIAGKRKFRASECEDWLEKEGWIVRESA